MWQLRKYSKIPAFSLLECLITLLVTAMILFSLSTSLQFYRHWHQTQFADQTSHWHHLCLLLENELQHFKLISVQSNTLILANEQQRYSLVLRRGTLYKTPGYHPYAFHIHKWYLAYEASILTMTITYDNGQTFTSYFYLEEF